MNSRRPGTKPLAGVQRWLVSTIAVLAVLPAGCSQPAILSTISCPVYQPPETPQPNWPKQCGGTR